MQFETELARVLPEDVPHRARLIEKASEHLSLIASANEHMNLTRITGAREAAIKHVYDSVAPWRHFAGCARVLDAGTGAGFPGIPLAIVLPEVRFTLSESVQKKARFVDSAIEALHLPNVLITSTRAEELAQTARADVITARAVAPLGRLVDLFRDALRQGARLLLYKGPDAERELAEAKQCNVCAELLSRYELPDELGVRTLIEIRLNSAGRGAPRKQARANRG